MTGIHAQTTSKKGYANWNNFLKDLCVVKMPPQAPPLLCRTALPSLPQALPRKTSNRMYRNSEAMRIALPHWPMGS